MAVNTDNKDVVCPTCKRSMGYKGIDLLSIFLNKDIVCDSCGSVVISCRPDVKVVTVTVYNNGYTAQTNQYNNRYDYD